MCHATSGFIIQWAETELSNVEQRLKNLLQERDEAVMERIENLKAQLAATEKKYVFVYKIRDANTW